MYKTEIFTNLKNKNIVNLLNKEDELIIKKKQDDYIMTSFVSEYDMAQIKQQVFRKKTMSIFMSENKKHNTMITFRFKVNSNEDGSNIIGEFNFSKLHILFFILLNIVFFSPVILFRNFGMFAAIAISIIPILGIILFDIMYIKQIKIYREFILDRIEKILKHNNIDVNIKRHNFFNNLE